MYCASSTKSYSHTRCSRPACDYGNGSSHYHESLNRLQHWYQRLSSLSLIVPVTKLRTFYQASVYLTSFAGDDALWVRLLAAFLSSIPRAAEPQTRSPGARCSLPGVHSSASLPSFQVTSRGRLCKIFFVENFCPIQPVRRSSLSLSAFLNVPTLVAEWGGSAIQG